MTRRQFAPKMLISAIFSAFIVGCGGTTSSPPDDHVEAKSSDVTVTKLSIVEAQSYPVQVRLLLEGYLTDACELAETNLERKNHTFFMDFETTGQGDASCRGRREFTRSILLPTHGLEKGRYEVIVDGRKTTFSW